MFVWSGNIFLVSTGEVILDEVSLKSVFEINIVNINESRNIYSKAQPFLRLPDLSTKKKNKKTKNQKKKNNGKLEFIV